MIKKKNRILILLLLISFAFLLSYIQKIKQTDNIENLKSVKINDLTISIGANDNQIGTGIFGEIQNNNKKTLEIATIKIIFLGLKGEKIFQKNISPINKYSFSDNFPLKAGEKKKFGFKIDKFIPDNWSGEYEANLIKVKFND